MKWVSILLLASVLSAADASRLFFSKKFPGSKPEYEQVIVTPDGAVDYREAPEDELPVKFKLSEEETKTVFELAGKLDHFNRPLEAQTKVPIAFMGTKTFRYENGAETHEVQFNYSADPSAQALYDWFERMAESAQYLVDLERSAKYDKLGVDKALRNLLAALDRKRLVGLNQFLPLLDRIAKNETYMHTARAKAAEMAEAIRVPKPPAGPQ
jgi:hypothetical protein